MSAECGARNTERCLSQRRKDRKGFPILTSDFSLLSRQRRILRDGPHPLGRKDHASHPCSAALAASMPLPSALSGPCLMTNDLDSPQYKEILDYIKSFVKAKE